MIPYDTTELTEVEGRVFVFQEIVAEVVVILVTCILYMLSGTILETEIEPDNAKTEIPGKIMHNTNKINTPSVAHFCFLNISPFLQV